MIKILFGIATVMLSIGNLLAYDLSSNDNNLIRLIGEYHSNPVCINYKNQLLKAEEDKKIILALEGMFFEKKTGSTLFGIEEQYTLFLATAGEYYLNFILYQIIQNMRSFKDEGWPPIINALENRFNAFFSPPENNLLRMYRFFIGFIYNGDKEDPIYRQISKIVGRIGDEKNALKLAEGHSYESPFFLNINMDIAEWVNLFKYVINLCCQELILKNEQISTRTLNEVITLVVRMQEYANIIDDKKLNEILPVAIKDIFSFGNIINNIRLHHRNQIFLKNIISIFEENKAQKKPFYVIIGVAHAPFLYEELTAKGYRVMLNDLAQISYNKHLVKLEESLNSSEL